MQKTTEHTLRLPKFNHLQEINHPIIIYKKRIIAKSGG